MVHLMIPMRKPLTLFMKLGICEDIIMCEVPSCYVKEVIRARKDHKCCECHGWIRRGEHYHKHHGVWDGSGFTFKVCIECDLLRTDIDKDVSIVEERTAFGQLTESVFECGKLEFIRRLLIIKDKRQGNIEPWMNEHFDKLINRSDELLELDYE